MASRCAVSLTSAEIQQRQARMLAACRRDGLRITRQRTEVYREIAATEAHPDAEAIHARVTRRIAVSLDTVYRTLAALEKAGAIGRVSALHGAARFDANTAKHHHFVCTECGLVRDFSSAELDAYCPPEAVRQWGEILSVHAELRGICNQCREARTGSPGA
ncbi:MAG: transcriptional repressor [Lentisphaeria bacterium]|nr:transcriptional repressor [Lentisphaeria bacterium]